MILLQGEAQIPPIGALPVGSVVNFGTSPGGLAQYRFGWSTLPPGFAGQQLNVGPFDQNGQAALSQGTGLAWGGPLLVWQVGGAMTAVASTASLTSLLGSGSANQTGIWVTSGGETGLTVPAYLANTPGSILKLDLIGTWGSTNAQPTILFTLTLGGVTVITGTAATISAPQTTTGGVWAASVSLTTVTAGSSGTVFGQGNPVIGQSVGTGTPGFSAPMPANLSGAINLTGAVALGFNAQWSASSASNTIVVSAGQATFLASPSL